MAYIGESKHSKVLGLKKIVPIEEGQTFSKILVQRDDLGMIIFSLDKDQEIGRHSSLGDVMANVLSRIAKIAAVDDDYAVKAGGNTVTPTGISHALYTEGAFQMLLTVVKSEVKHDQRLKNTCQVSRWANCWPFVK